MKIKLSILLTFLFLDATSFLRALPMEKEIRPFEEKVTTRTRSITADARVNEAHRTEKNITSATSRSNIAVSEADFDGLVIMAPSEDSLEVLGKKLFETQVTALPSPSKLNTSLQELGFLSSRSDMENIHEMRPSPISYPHEVEDKINDTSEVSHGQIGSMSIKNVPSVFKTGPIFTEFLKSQKGTDLAGHEIHQVETALRSMHEHEQDGHTTPPASEDATISNSRDSTPERSERAISSEKEIDSIQSNILNEVDRVEVLSEALEQGKAVLQYAADMCKAVLNVESVFFLTIQGRRDDKASEPISEANIAISIAANAIDTTLTNIETNLTELKSDQDNQAKLELSSAEVMSLVELNLGMTALQEAIKEVHSRAESAMDNDRYRGEIADEALASLRSLYKNHDAVFESAIASTRSVPMAPLVFSTVAAKKEALKQLLQHAEKAKMYAKDLMDGPVQEFHDILDGYLDNDVADEHLDQLTEGEGDVTVALSIANVAIKNASERLERWDAVADENVTLSSSDLSETAFLFASLEVAIHVLEEAAKNISTATEPLESYKSPWGHPDHLDKKLERILTDLETIRANYNVYKMSLLLESDK